MVAPLQRRLGLAPWDRPTKRRTVDLVAELARMKLDVDHAEAVIRLKNQRIRELEETVEGLRTGARA